MSEMQSDGMDLSLRCSKASLHALPLPRGLCSGTTSKRPSQLGKVLYL